MVPGALLVPKYCSLSKSTHQVNQLFIGSSTKSWRTLMIPSWLWTSWIKNDLYKLLGSSVKNFRHHGELEEKKLPMSLQIIINQGVLEDILDSWMEFRWLWTSGITDMHIIKVSAKFLASRSTGKEHSCRTIKNVFQGVLADNLGELEKKSVLWVSRLSTKGSWKTFWFLNGV